MMQTFNREVQIMTASNVSLKSAVNSLIEEIRDRLPKESRVKIAVKQNSSGEFETTIHATANGKFIKAKKTHNVPYISLSKAYQAFLRRIQFRSRYRPLHYHEAFI